MTSPPWPPPQAPAPRTIGWYLASNGHWYPSAQPPGLGFWLASDGRWYPPALAPAHPGGDVDRPWQRSRWGFGDVWWGVLAYVAANVVTGVAIAVVVALSNPERGLEDVSLGPYAISVLIIGNVVAFAGIPWLASRRKGLRSLGADFGLRFRPIDVAIGLGAGCAGLVASAVVGTLLDHLIGADEATSNMPVDDLRGAGEFLVFVLAVGVVTPVIEELFFRGLVLRSFWKRGVGRVASIAWTTLIFVLPHLLAAESWQGAVSLFGAIAVLGLAFALACHWTGGRLGAPIVAHSLVNTIAIVVVFAG